MLSIEVVLEINRLLGEGQTSQRAIARKLGVSRGVVQNIASGKRSLTGAFRRSDDGTSTENGHSPMVRTRF